MVAIGTKIRKIRELKNFTQEYMAEELKVSQSTYSRFEKDDADLSISQVRKIAELLDVKVEDLLNDEKFVFNIMHNQVGIQDLHLSSGASDKEKELYEKAIKLLEDKVALLERLAAK